MAALTSSLVVRLIDQVTAPAKKVSSALLGLNNQAKGGFGGRLSSAIATNNAALSQTRAKLFDAAAAFYVLQRAISAPVRDAMAFESAMADVRKVVDFPTPKAFTDFKNGLVELSRVVPLSVNGLAQIAAAAGQAGIARGDLLEFTEAAAKVGVAFDISADQAGDAMAKLMTGLGLTLEEAVLLTDSMNHLSNAQASAASEVLDVVRRVGAQAKMFGFTAQEVSAFGSAMISAGAQSEVAATSFRNMGNALTRGASATKRQRSAFKALGLDAKEVAASMQKDAAGTVVHVLERLAALPKEIQAATSSNLFGNEARALGPLLTNLDLVRDSLGLVGDEADYAGSSFKEFEVRAATFENAGLRFRNRITAMSIAIGNSLMPALSELMDKLGPVIDRIAQFASAHPELIANIALATAGLIAFKAAGVALTFVGLLGRGGALSLLSIGFKGVVAAGTPIAGMFQLMGVRAAMATAATGKAPGLFARMGDALLVLGNTLTGPVGGLRTLAMWAGRLSLPMLAVGAAVKFVVDNLDGITAMFGGMGDGFLKGLDMSGIDKLGKAFEPLAPILKPVADAMGLIGNFITGASFDIGVSTGEWASWGNVIGKTAAAGVNVLVGGINALIEGITGAIGLANDLGTAIANLWNSGGRPPPISEGARPGQRGPMQTGHRAGGGNVWPGGSFLVGEKEPELFSPSTSGTITPASKLGGGPISFGPFHFHGLSGDPAELKRAVREATEDAINGLLRGAHADVGAR